MSRRLGNECGRDYCVGLYACQYTESLIQVYKIGSLQSEIDLTTSVIVITVRDRQEVEEKARRLGAAAYLSKPIQVDALMESLQSVLATQEGVPAGVAANMD